MFATPVTSVSGHDLITSEADEVIALHTVAERRSPRSWYRDQSPVTGDRTRPQSLSVARQAICALSVAKMLCSSAVYHLPRRRSTLCVYSGRFQAVRGHTTYADDLPAPADPPRSQRRAPGSSFATGRLRVIGIVHASITTSTSPDRDLSAWHDQHGLDDAIGGCGE